MTADFSDLKFDSNHKKSSAAREALTGLRLVLLSLVIYIGLVAVAIGSAVNPELAAFTGTTLAWIVWWVLSLAAFGAGAYGTYLTMDALGWAGYISFFIIASFLIPYFRLVSLLFVIVMGLDVVSKGGYRITLFGPATRRAELPAEA